MLFRRAASGENTKLNQKVKLHKDFNIFSRIQKAVKEDRIFPWRNHQ